MEERLLLQMCVCRGLLLSVRVLNLNLQIREEPVVAQLEGEMNVAPQGGHHNTWQYKQLQPRRQIVSPGLFVITKWC